MSATERKAQPSSADVQRQQALTGTTIQGLHRTAARNFGDSHLADVVSKAQALANWTLRRSKSAALAQELEEKEREKFMSTLPSSGRIDQEIAYLTNLQQTSEGTLTNEEWEQLLAEKQKEKTFAEIKEINRYLRTCSFVRWGVRMGYAGLMTWSSLFLYQSHTIHTELTDQLKPEAGYTRSLELDGASSKLQGAERDLTRTWNGEYYTRLDPKSAAEQLGVASTVVKDSHISDELEELQGSLGPTDSRTPYAFERERIKSILKEIGNLRTQAWQTVPEEKRTQFEKNSKDYGNAKLAFGGSSFVGFLVLMGDFMNQGLTRLLQIQKRLRLKTLQIAP